MATTNLISKSLGGILTESGNGTPNHVSPKGSLYTDQDTGKLYQNADGSTTWNPMRTVAYGEAFFQDSVTTTVITTTNVWTPGTYTFTSGELIGFSANTNSLVLLSGYDGIYEIKGDVTISYVAGTNNYEVGVSISGADPTPGTYSGSLVDVTYIRQDLGMTFITSLVGGNSIGFDVRNITNADDIILRHGQLFVRKVG